MSINLNVPEESGTPQLKPKLTVIGVGGAGGNAVNNMAEAPSAAYCPPEEQAGRRFGRLGQWLRENF